MIILLSFLSKQQDKTRETKEVIELNRSTNPEQYSKERAMVSYKWNVYRVEGSLGPRRDLAIKLEEAMDSSVDVKETDKDCAVVYFTNSWSVVVAEGTNGLTSLGCQFDKFAEEERFLSIARELSGDVVSRVRFTTDLMVRVLDSSAPFGYDPKDVQFGYSDCKEGGGARLRRLVLDIPAEDSKALFRARKTDLRISNSPFRDVILPYIHESTGLKVMSLPLRYIRVEDTLTVTAEGILISDWQKTVPAKVLLALIDGENE